MKISRFLPILVLLLTVILVPNMSRAQTLLDTAGATSIGASLESEAANAVPTNIRAKLLNDSRLQNLKDNIKTNETIREDTIKARAETLKAQKDCLRTRAQGTSTKVSDDCLKIRAQGTSTVPRAIAPRIASSTRPGEDRGDIDRNRDNRNEIDNRGQKMLENIRKDIFEMQKKHLVQELNQSLKNLTQVRDRIVARIDKAEKAGRSMTTAKAALAIADAKLTLARKSIDALALLLPQNTKTASSTATTTPRQDRSASSTDGTLVDLAKPRAAGNVAIKAVNDARKALNEVVVAIAHSMGLKVSNEGKIEDSERNPQNPGSTPVASTTPSVSPASSL